MWDVQTMEQVAELTGHVGIIYSLQVIEAPGQTRLFSACYDKTLRVSTFTVAYRDVWERHKSMQSCTQRYVEMFL